MASIGKVAVDIIFKYEYVLLIGYSSGLGATDPNCAAQCAAALLQLITLGEEKVWEHTQEYAPGDLIHMHVTSREGKSQDAGKLCLHVTYK